MGIIDGAEFLKEEAFDEVRLACEQSHSCTRCNGGGKPTDRTRLGSCSYLYKIKIFLTFLTGPERTPVPRLPDVLRTAWQRGFLGRS